MREERYYIILVIVRGVFGLGASSPGAAQHPAIVFISTLQGRLEGVMVEERGEGVVVEAEAMEREAQVKEELAEKLKLEVEELASRAKEAEEKRALSSARRHEAEAELEKLKPETEELERQLAERRERRRSLQAASPPTSPS